MLDSFFTQSNSIIFVITFSTSLFFPSSSLNIQISISVRINLHLPSFASFFNLTWFHSYLFHVFNVSIYKKNNSFNIEWHQQKCVHRINNEQGERERMKISFDQSFTSHFLSKSTVKYNSVTKTKRQSSKSVYFLFVAHSFVIDLRCVVQTFVCHREYDSEKEKIFAFIKSEM